MIKREVNRLLWKLRAVATGTDLGEIGDYIEVSEGHTLRLVWGMVMVGQMGSSLRAEPQAINAVRGDASVIHGRGAEIMIDGKGDERY